MNKTILLYVSTSIKYIVGVIFGMSVLTSCDSNSNKTAQLNKGEVPIVSVYGNTLYLKDLEAVMGEGLAPEDSARIADAYVRKWINEELIYEKAKQNITDKLKINELVEDYRQTLTTYTYQEELLKEVLAKKISDDEMKKYYDTHSDNFKLDFCIIKGLFLKIPLSSPDLSNLKKWYQSNSSEAKEKIEKASLQNAVIYDYFYNRWVNLEEVTVNMPYTISDPVQFLKSNKNLEASDSTYTYLLHIEEYALPGETAPYEFVKPKIHDILINKYKDEFLNQFEEDLYKDAVEDKNVTYYNKKV